MANLDRLKKKSSMGTPPNADEASTNLQAPETAPADLTMAERPAALPPAASQAPAAAPASTPRIDGRTLRRSGRTITFATRVTPDFDASVRHLAQERGLMIVEVLEEALAAYKKAIS